MNIFLSLRGCRLLLAPQGVGLLRPLILLALPGLVLLFHPEENLNQPSGGLAGAVPRMTLILLRLRDLLARIISHLVMVDPVKLFVTPLTLESWFITVQPVVSRQLLVSLNTFF